MNRSIAIKTILSVSVLWTMLFASTDTLILQNGLHGYEGCYDANTSSTAKTYNLGNSPKLYSFNCQT